MSRIRTIKPEFCESESIGNLSRDARLLFILLWTILDDEGRARATSRLLASRLYPYDDDAYAAIDGWLEELCASGHVRLYVVDGATYIDVPKWLKHQKIDHPGKSRLPPHPESLAKPREDEREVRASYLGPRTIVPSTSPQKKASRVPSAQSCLPPDWEATPEELEYAKAQGSSNPKETAERFKLYHLSKGTLARNWKAAFQYWCRRQKDFRAVEPEGSGPRPLKFN